MAELARVWVRAEFEDLVEPQELGEVMLSRQGGRRTAGFAFDDRWLARQDPRIIDPDLMPFRGPQHPKAGRALFGFLADSAPDRWGRLLMQRREAMRARAEGRPPRQLDDYDFLLGVHDRARLGALRFRTAHDGPFLAPDDPWSIPPWARLRELEAAARSVDHPQSGEDDSRWLELIYAPGSSLGGARPKASVHDEAGHLWIAKFPARRDAVDVGAWEYLVHLLAAEAGLLVPEAQIRRMTDAGTIFLGRRFDRTADNRRIHFASAMTLLGRIDNDSLPASYIDLAEAIRRYGERPGEDLAEMWSRMIFSMAVGNCDDHLRNHGFLLGCDGWRLAPVYDVNPDPTGAGLTLAVTADGDNRLDFGLALSVSDYFGLSTERARVRMAAILDAVSHWRERARQIGIPRREIEQLTGAFRTAY